MRSSRRVRLNPSLGGWQVITYESGHSQRTSSLPADRRWRAACGYSSELKNQKIWQERLKTLPNFDGASWEAWANAVYERMYMKMRFSRV
jgi:hypothetical protein